MAKLHKIKFRSETYGWGAICVVTHEPTIKDKRETYKSNYSKYLISTGINFFVVSLYLMSLVDFQTKEKIVVCLNLLRISNMYNNIKRSPDKNANMSYYGSDSWKIATIPTIISTKILYD